MKEKLEYIATGDKIELWIKDLFYSNQLLIFVYFYYIIIFNHHIYKFF
jgi:hypothetical protein